LLTTEIIPKKGVAQLKWISGAVCTETSGCTIHSCSLSSD